jgi:cellulose synthase/poly-beta-1,6-N-acetylglucosamine synthase-like glycosyltransferase
MSAEVLFWLSLATCVYVYAGYPALLVAMAAVLRRPVRKAPVEPTVSLVIPAYNEERVIEAKIHNALALDYPAEKLEVVVVSDGSTDRTNAIAARYAERGRVRLVAYPSNRGKLAALNDAVAGLRGEIVVFSDAASMLRPDALRRLLECFADPQVGAASGLYRVRNARAAELGEQEDFYWKYETFLKRLEAELHSIIGAHGALYAVRRELYPFPAPGIINDDYVIPVRILQKGYRVYYETRAVASEEAHEMRGFSRRVRIMTGNFQQLRELPALLWPPRPLPLFFFVSHKAARLLVPFAMIGLAVSNLFLLSRTMYAAALLGQAAFYAAVALGALFPRGSRLLRLPYYFCMINAAAFLGIYYALAGREKLLWKRR